MVDGGDDGPLAADSSAADAPVSSSPGPPSPGSPSSRLRSRALLAPDSGELDSAELSWPELEIPVQATGEEPAPPELPPTLFPPPDSPSGLELSAGLPTPDPTERELGFREPVTEEVDSEATLKPKLLSPVIVKEIARRESESRLAIAVPPSAMPPVVPPPKLSAFSNLSSSSVAARPVVPLEETETLRREQPAVGPDSDEITKLDHEAQMLALEKARAGRFPFPERVTGPRPPSIHDDDESGTSLPLSSEALFSDVEARKVGGTALLDLITPRRYAANSVLPRDVSVFIKEDSLEALPPLPPSPPSVLGRIARWLFIMMVLAGLSYGAFVLGKLF